MPSPFPGMDPYLEGVGYWPSLHHRLSTQIAIQLEPLLEPKYYADIEVRTVFYEIGISRPPVMLPDVGIFERAVATRVATVSPLAPAHSANGLLAAPLVRELPELDQAKLVAIHIKSLRGDLVTTIEILSPINKRPGEGVDDYRAKRTEILHSRVHLIELDLLRGGERPGPEVCNPPIDTDYIALVNRGEGRNPRASEIWPIALNDPLPRLPVPLWHPDPDVVLDLAAVMAQVYDQAPYGRIVDYRRPVPPPDLRPSVAAWWAERRAARSPASAGGATST